MGESLFPQAHARIVTSCLTYLSFDVFGSGYYCSDSARKSVLQEYVFLDYAANHWGHHARGLAEETVKDEALAFLGDCAKVAFASHFLRAGSWQHEILWDCTPDHLSGVHLSSHFALETILHYQVEKGYNPDARGRYGWTPLSIAAQRGNGTVIELLLGWGVDVNSEDDAGRTPLSFAAARGHDAVVKLLIAQDDIDVNSNDRYHWTPLVYAADRGHDAVVKLLISRGDIDVNTVDMLGRTALSIAGQGNHEAVVELLLSHEEIDVNRRSIEGKTPLSIAAEEHHDAVVKMLRARGASI